MGLSVRERDLYFVAKRIQVSDPWPSRLKLALQFKTSPNWFYLTAAVYKSKVGMYFMLLFTRF